MVRTEFFFSYMYGQKSVFKLLQHFRSQAFLNHCFRVQKKHKKNANDYSFKKMYALPLVIACASLEGIIIIEHNGYRAKLYGIVIMGHSDYIGHFIKPFEGQYRTHTVIILATTLHQSTDRRITL